MCRCGRKKTSLTCAGVVVRESRLTLSLRELSELASEPSVSVTIFPADFCNHLRKLIYSIKHN